MRRLLIIGVALLAACGDKPAEKRGVPPTLITVTEVKSVTIENEEATLGSLEAVNDPKIAAEVSGRVVEIAVRAGQAVKKGQLLARLDPADATHLAAADNGEAARLEALLVQQERVVARQTELVARNFISKNALDEAKAQRDALKNQHAAARARAGLSGGNLGKTRIQAPFDGVVEEQAASLGDYVRPGDVLFRVVSNARLRVHLPFPESVLPRLKPGQPVRVESPLLPGKTLAGVIEDIRPTVSETARSVDAIARLDNPGGLRGGGSVKAVVITGRREAALAVPEQSLVLRPAGRVVYAIVGGKAEQRLVETGGRQAGLVEIVTGLRAGETVALDGAGFLSHGAAVAVSEAAKKQAEEIR